MFPKFERRKYTGLDGVTYVAFEDPKKENSFTVEASKKGINFYGTLGEPIEDRVELNALAKLIGNAWTEVERLRPKLMKDLPPQLDLPGFKK